MMSDRRTIGIDRRIDREWLDAVAGHVAAGADESSIRSALFQLLDGVVAGGNRRGTGCHKTIGVLSRIWVNNQPEVRGMRDRGAALLPQLSPAQRLGLHWALLTATYPFFADVVTNTGRLLALQGDLNLAQLTRRVREQWGDRSTINRAVQRVVRSLVQWGALSDSDQRGIYVAAKEPIALPDAVAELLLEALLMRQDGGSLPVDQALRHPGFFPFRLELRAQQIRMSPRFDVHRQGLDVDVVALVQTEAGKAP
jgi:hypothetical protein